MTITQKQGFLKILYKVYFFKIFFTILQSKYSEFFQYKVYFLTPAYSKVDIQTFHVIFCFLYIVNNTNFSNKIQNDKTRENTVTQK